MTGKTYVTSAAAEAAAMNEEKTANGNDFIDCNVVDIEQPQTVTAPFTPSMVAPRNSNDITLSPWLKRLGMDFPLFTDAMMQQYRKHNVENFNPFVFVPTILTLYAGISVRDGLAGFYTYGGK